MTCVSAHGLVHGECEGGGGDRASPRRRERQEGRSGQRLDDWRSGTARQRERERAGAGNWRRQVGPSRLRAKERARAGERTSADRQGPPVRRRGHAAWLGRAGLVWAAFSFPFYLDFLIPFLFLFYRVFKSKFKLGFKSK
jgi:hypothetical protein